MFKLLLKILNIVKINNYIAQNIEHENSYHRHNGICWKEINP
jgi:hypothetical protein